MFTVVIYCPVFVYILRKTKKAGYGETSNNKCGMPLISIMKAKVLAFHITACVGDNLNFGWNSNQDPNYPESSGLTKGKWYSVEVSQEYRTSTSSSSSGYYWQIQINGPKVMEELNDKPREFNDLVVYSSNIWSTGTVYNDYFPSFSLVQSQLCKAAENTRIRNFKFRTKQDDSPGWFVPTGEDCWDSCGGAGNCDWCGVNGYCCSADSTTGAIGDCTDEMIDAIKNSDYGNTKYHLCVARREEDSCIDWNTQKGIDCAGSDVRGGFDVNSLHECQDACLGKEPIV